ncbi:MAG TPA: hypothetical protein EYP34_01730 [Chromatiaceae bacterium]|nr:hypothetical protein [Chromatiaceae bacterium]
MIKNRVIPVLSWLLTAWICKVFLSSLFYKFTGHPDTQHIFSTIGNWLRGFLGDSMGSLFSQYGGYLVGSFELLTSIVLLPPILFWVLKTFSPGIRLPRRSTLHCIGGLMATAVMSGAVFFHLVSPLGVEVLHEGKGDGGSLFYAAVSILVSGIILFILNRRHHPNPD